MRPQDGKGCVPSLGVYEDSSWAVRRRKKQSLALHICTEQPQSPNSLIQHKCEEGRRRERFKQDLPSWLLIWYLFCKILFLSNSDPYVPAVLIFFVLVIASHRAQPIYLSFRAIFIRCKACVLFAVQEFVLLVIFFNIYIYIKMKTGGFESFWICLSSHRLVEYTGFVSWPNGDCSTGCH